LTTSHRDTENTEKLRFVFVSSVPSWFGISD